MLPLVELLLALIIDNAYPVAVGRAMQTLVGILKAASVINLLLAGLYG